VVLLAVGSFVDAQQSGKLIRIGYLSSVDPARESNRAEEIYRALRERGYIEGLNIVTEYRYAGGQWDRLPELVAELVWHNVDIIVIAGGDQMTRAAMKATKTIPIVMVGEGADPVEAGLIESLGLPGGNVTGLTNITTESSGKRLELFKEAFPKVVRIAAFY